MSVIHCHDWSVGVLIMRRLDKIKEYEISSPINSASLHPDQQVFVCGGEDFKMYKCDFTTGAELGNAARRLCFVCVMDASRDIFVTKMKIITVHFTRIRMEFLSGRKTKTKRTKNLCKLNERK